MSAFGAIPAFVSEAITAGEGAAITVRVGATLMSFVPDQIRVSPQAWWTSLGGWVDSEGLVTSGRHSVHPPKDRNGFKLNRLRFVDSLPGAKVLVWPNEWTVFIYVRKGLGKAEAARAVRSALRAAGRPQLSAVRSSVIGLGVGGGLRVPQWLAASHTPHGVIGAIAGTGVLTIIVGTSGLVFTGHVPEAGGRGGANVTPVIAERLPPVVFPRRSHPTTRVGSDPSSFVQTWGSSPTALPSPTPSPSRTVHVSPTPQPSAETPVPPPVPEPVPSSQLAPTGLPSFWLPTATRR